MRLASYWIPSTAVTLVLALSGCSADGASTSKADGPCNDEAAQGLVGREKPTDEEAMRLTGSQIVRKIEPGQMVTQDFREDRVTIEIDSRSGLVTQATCG